MTLKLSRIIRRYSHPNEQQATWQRTAEDQHPKLGCDNDFQNVSESTQCWLQSATDL